MIALTKTAQELTFDADSTLSTLIHLGLNTFKTGSLSTASHIDRYSTLIVEIIVT